MSPFQELYLLRASTGYYQPRLEGVSKLPILLPYIYIQIYFSYLGYFFLSFFLFVFDMTTLDVHADPIISCKILLYARNFHGWWYSNTYISFFFFF